MGGRTTPWRNFGESDKGRYHHQCQHNNLATQGTLYVCKHCLTLLHICSSPKHLSQWQQQSPNPFPLLHSSTVGRIITSQSCQDAISGDSKQTILVLYAIVACLDTIAACIGKEASNPYMLQTAQQDNCTTATSVHLSAATNALSNCLHQVDLVTMGGALLHPTMLYQDLDQKQKQDICKMFATTKRLKLVSTANPSGGCTWHNKGATTPLSSTPNEASPVNPPLGTNSSCNHSCCWYPNLKTGDVKYATDGLMPMPKGHGQRFCAAFLRKGATCGLKLCPIQHTCINNMPQADHNIWIKHVHNTSHMSMWIWSN